MPIIMTPELFAAGAGKAPASAKARALAQRGPPPVVSIDSLAVDARLKLHIAMTWPRSLQRRDEALATFAACALDQGEIDAVAALFSRDLGTAPDLVAGGMRRTIEDDILAPAGGVAAVARAPGVEQVSSEIVRVHRTVVSPVGALLCFAAQLDLFHRDVGASWNRAWAILQAERRRGKRLPARNSAFRKAIWDEWACVAPLCAAHDVALSLRRAGMGGTLDGVAPPWSADEIEEILGWALWFRRWATGFVSRKHPGAKAFIPDAEASTYETRAPEREPPLAPLAAERLAAARSYWKSPTW